MTVIYLKFFFKKLNLILNLFQKDTSNEEPMRAHMPSWANNPDYTLHATTTKPDDGQRRTVFSVFDTTEDDVNTESTEMSQMKGSPQHPLTRL